MSAVMHIQAYTWSVAPFCTWQAYDAVRSFARSLARVCMHEHVWPHQPDTEPCDSYERRACMAMCALRACVNVSVCLQHNSLHCTSDRKPFSTFRLCFIRQPVVLLFGTLFNAKARYSFHLCLRACFSTVWPFGNKKKKKLI